MARKKVESVADYLRELDHPCKAELVALRAIVARANAELTEGLKWNAPSFAFRGDDRLTFNLSARDRVRLVFHRGAGAAPARKKGRLIEDPAGLLEWAADDRAIASFENLDEVKAGARALTDLVRRWLAATT